MAAAQTIDFVGPLAINQGAIWSYILRLKDDAQVITKGSGVSEGVWSAAFGISGFVNKTASISYNATNTDVKNALETLPSIGVGGVKSCTGSAGGPWTVTLTDEVIAASGNPVIQVDGSGLTGGGISVARHALDLTGYSAKMDIRSTPSTSGTLYITLSTANGRIVLGYVSGGSPDPTNGVIRLHIDEVDTNALTFTSGFYDLELTDATPDITRIIQGTVTLDPQVTN